MAKLTLTPIKKEEKSDPLGTIRGPQGKLTLTPRETKPEVGRTQLGARQTTSDAGVKFAREQAPTAVQAMRPGAVLARKIDQQSKPKETFTGPNAAWEAKYHSASETARRENQQAVADRTALQKRYDDLTRQVQETERAHRRAANLGETVTPKMQAELDYLKGQQKDARERLGAAKSQVIEAAGKYYEAENLDQFSALSKDQGETTDLMGRRVTPSGVWSTITEADQDREKLGKVMAALSFPVSPEEEKTIRTYREELKRKYGITDAALNQMGWANEEKERMEDGTYTARGLERMLAQRAQKGAETLKDQGYDYERMSGFAQRLINQQRAQEGREKIAKDATESPLSAVGYSIGSVVAAPFQALDLIGLDPGKGKPEMVDSYVPADTSNMVISDVVNTVRGSVSKKIEDNTNWELFGQNVASFLYGTGMSMVDSAAQVATLGPNATYLMGMNAAVNGVKDAIDSGATREQAFAVGLANGAAECFFERFSVENLLTPKNMTTWKDMAKEILKQGGTEASEEIFTEIANIFSDVAIMGQKSDFSEKVQEYLSQGMTKTQAEEKAYLDLVSQVAWAGAGGFLSGIGMGGPVNAMNFAAQQQSQNRVNQIQQERQEQAARQARLDHADVVLADHVMAQRMGENGRIGLTNAIETRRELGMFGENVTEGQMAEGYQEVYLAGLNGIAVEPGGIPAMAGENAEKLTPTERMQAYNNGVNDAKAKAEEIKRAAQFPKVAGTEKGLVYDDYVKTELTRETADRINALAKRLNLRVQFEDTVAGGAANGQILGADIVIAKDAENPVMVVLGHEVGHWLETMAPEQYQTFRQFASQRSQGEIAYRMAQYEQAGLELDYDGVLREYVADDIGRMIADPETLDRFIQDNGDNRTLLQKVADALRALWQKLTGRERQQVKTAEETLVAALKASEKRGAALEEIGHVADFSQEADGVEYSIKETAQEEVTKKYQRAVDAVMDGSYGKSEAMVMGYTPDVYQKLGMPSLPFVIGPGHVYSIAKTTAEAKAEGRYRSNTNFHGLGVETVKNLYDKATQPVMVIAAKDEPGNKSKSRSKHSVIAIVDVGTEGKNLLIPIEITAERTVNGQQMDVNVLSSAYERSVTNLVNEAIAMENAGQTGIYYATKEAKTLLVDGVQYPKRLTEALASTGIVHSIPENVNMKVMDQTQSLQFKRWFGDWQNDPAHASKVVDSEGKPLVVYHGTLAKGITAFNKEFIGSRYSADDVGFFFTDKESIAKDYAHSEFNADRVGEVIPAYLDIKKPLVVDAKYVRENGYGNIFEGMDSIDAWDVYQGAFLEAAEEMDADGILVKDGESIMAVVFEPAQIKSATDNIGTFDKENPDIRFSLKDRGGREKIAELERENTDLQKKYEYWKGQTRRSDTGKVSEAQVGRFAKMMMDHIGVKGDAKALTMKMLTLYDGMASGKDIEGGDFTYQDAERMARDIAGDLVSRAVLQDDTLYRDYAALRGYIRSHSIVVDAETRASIPDYNDFRKRNMGRLRLAHGETGNIDLVYNELSKDYPSLFDPEITSGQDQLERIAEVMDMVYARKEFNPWAGDMARATQTFANEIMEQFWDLPGQEATFADRQWRQREELKRRHMAEIQDTVRAEREKSRLQQQKLKQFFKDKAAEQRAYKAENEIRNRLLKRAARMKRMPVDNTNKTVIRELIGDLDTDARHLTGKKLTELTELRRFVEEKADPNSDIYDPDFILDQRTADNLRRLEMKHIDDLTLQDVMDLNQALLNLENEIRTSKRLIGEAEARDVYQLGEQAIQDIHDGGRGKTGKDRGLLDKFIVTETLSPVRQVRRMVGYKADSPLVRLTEGLADGQRKMMDYQMRAEKPFERFAQDQDFTKGFSGKDAAAVKISGWVKGKLQEVEVTPAMRVSLWLHSQNDQNALHMRDGGVRVPDLELYRKGKLADAYAAGTVVKLSPAMAKGLWQQMTDTERAFAREAQRYFKEVSQPAINEVSRQLKGYDIAEVENYYPIRTDKTFGKAELETLKFDGTIEGMGFLKERQNFAHNPMYLEDVNTVVEQAIRMHGKYVGLAIPVRNFGKVWNVSVAVAVEDDAKTASTGEAAIKADTSLFEGSVLQNLNQARISFIEFAKKHFPTSVKNAETGREIGISRTGLDKFLSGRIAYEKYASGFHIPELIERAHKVARAENQHVEQAKSIPTYEYYDSEIEIDGKDYMAHIRVRNTLMGDKYYGHTISEIDDIKIEPSARTSVPGETPAVQPVNAIDGSKNSIPQEGRGVKWISYGDSVQNAVQAVWGKSGYDYITKMMTDLQGGGKQAPAWAKTFGKVRSNYAGAVLTLNASVAMKQAASYPTAAAVLGWGPLAKAMRNMGKVDLDLIAKYTPLQWYRSKGFSTKELGDIQNYGGVMKEVLGKKGLNWIQGVDLATTRKLWKASEYYVQDNSPSLKIGSEEYYRAVADIYNRVIEETQPNYTTMQRPQLLRSDDTLMGNLAMFKTQPFQNFNILYDAAGEYRAVMDRAKAGEATKAEIKAARTNLSRAVTSQVGQLAVFAAMTMAWAMFRGRKDKYEDDEGNVTLWSALGGLGKDMLSGVASMVPFGTEAYEFGSSKLFGERYYGMEPVAVEAITNAVSSISKLSDTIWGTAQSVLAGEDVDWKGVLYQVDDSADDISKVAGVPYENVMNLFNGVARWALIGAKGKYLGEYAALHLTVDREKNTTPYMDLLYNAMENDREAYDTMWSQMVKDGFDQKKIKNAMEDRMKKAQGVTKTSEMEERYVDPDDREAYERALKLLEESALYGKATEEQVQDARADVYQFATRAGGETDQARWDRWEAAGMDAGMYALYKLALEMADEPNRNGKLGTYTSEEKEKAIQSMDGLTAGERVALRKLVLEKEKGG